MLALACLVVNTVKKAVNESALTGSGVEFQSMVEVEHAGSVISGADGVKENARGRTRLAPIGPHGARRIGFGGVPEDRACEVANRWRDGMMQRHKKHRSGVCLCVAVGVPGASLHNEGHGCPSAHFRRTNCLRLKSPAAAPATAVGGQPFERVPEIGVW
jgi:hypothetical protein